MTRTAPTATETGPGLTDLASVPLGPRHTRMLEMTSAQSRGPAMWRARKAAEARDLLALAEIAPRLRVREIDLRTTLRALLHLRCPVPCMPDGSDDLFVAGEALLGMSYPLEALRLVLPGHAFVQILSPARVWHPNIADGSQGGGQVVCLGAQVPSGIRITELVLATYGALTLQNVQLDEFDSSGVINLRAARWWQANARRLPLSPVPFLGREDLGGADAEEELR